MTKGERETMHTRQKLALLLITVLIGIFGTTAFSSAATVLKTSTTNYQYGGASFDPKKTFSQFSNSLKVQEKGDYTIVTWIDETGFDGKQVYMSVAKKNKWLFRGKEILYVENPDLDMMVIITDNYIFYGNKNGLKAVTVNLENGKKLSEKPLETWEDPAPFSSKYFFPIKTNDGSGVMFENEDGQYRIYLGGELDKAITIEDPKRVLRNHLYSYQQNIVLTSKRDRLVLINGLGSYVFNIEKKDMIYDSKGQSQIFRGLSFYSNGKFYGYKSGGTVTIQTFNENFKVLSTSLFKPSNEYLNSGEGTIIGNTIHFWSFNNYQNTNALKVNSFNLSK
ncbi:hypothetical protein [Paenibacillus gansuensis]|uniref:DUF5050 domain-containing protein n=1 Tax=Paenibacillus gansuensis TaxID=306542 RepID=A0ABW5PKP8_9BACL